MYVVPSFLSFSYPNQIYDNLWNLAWQHDMILDIMWYRYWTSFRLIIMLSYLHCRTESLLYNQEHRWGNLQTMDCFDYSKSHHYTEDSSCIDHSGAHLSMNQMEWRFLQHKTMSFVLNERLQIYDMRFIP